jgi:hypothetical protein
MLFMRQERSAAEPTRRKHRRLEMRKFWIMAATVALLGFGAAIVSAQGGPSTIDDSTTTAETTTTPTTTTANERPRQRRDDERGGAVRESGEDVSGPCDEAEHANDPRCTGAGGRVEDRDDDDRDDDHSGPGRGGDDDRGDDSSGHGGGRDDD